MPLKLKLGYFPQQRTAVAKKYKMIMETKGVDQHFSPQSTLCQAILLCNIHDTLALTHPCQGILK